MLIRFKYNDITNILIRVKGNLELQTSAYFTPLPISFGNLHNLARNWWQSFHWQYMISAPLRRITGRNGAVYLKFKASQGLVIVWGNRYKYEDQLKPLPKCMSKSGGCMVVLVEKSCPLPAHKISKSLY
jgi:hypothetical protein